MLLMSAWLFKSLITTDVDLKSSDLRVSHQSRLASSTETAIFKSPSARHAKFHLMVSFFFFPGKEVR